MLDTGANLLHDGDPTTSRAKVVYLKSRLQITLLGQRLCGQFVGDEDDTEEALQARLGIPHHDKLMLKEELRSDTFLFD